VFAYRFRSLDLPPEVQPWLRRGRELLEQAEADVEESWERLTFREHLAYSLIHEEKAEEAIRVLAPIWRMRNVVSTEPRIQGRALATLGNAYRLTGRRRKACICLSRAEHILNEHDFSGDLADFAWIGMAKLERSRSRALQWLEQAKQIQQELGSPVGLTRSLLIEARRCCDAGLALNRKNEIVRLRSNLPGLQNCLLLERILANWDRWISELGEGNETDTFWGL
jgi:tetratricopeptide (TPR) repeat protein